MVVTRRLRRTIAALGTLTVIGALAACGGADGATGGSTSKAEVAPPTQLVESGTLTYGTAASFPPFEFKGSSGQPDGFDIEMIQKLGASMGLNSKPLDIDFDGLIPALQGRRIDVINSAMYIKPEREKVVDFVPYMVIGESLLVPKGNPKKIAKVPDDLSGKTVAVTRGAIGEQYMNEFNKQLKAAGKPAMNILALPTNQDALLAVKSGRADTFDTSTPGAAYTITQEKGSLEVAATFDLGTKIGIAVRKGDTETAKAVKAALDKFVASGEYGKLLEKYHLPPEVNYFKKG
ncbi:ABC transporter substrate-binding protein [Actinopolymorpha alba]|uniref:ABC transporter substrate-binding protein n=1 Tax=Actinopolymorpha alba TaxID=533267 RepID=UPI0012F69FCC|nr:ABC transporter substrate-binding protein [Actinopolymorpha alba]